MTDKTLQTITGTVVKRSSSQTIKVMTKVTKVHPLYRKRYTLSRHFTAHDPQDNAKVGDTVTIVACRPISKNKHFIIK